MADIDYKKRYNDLKIKFIRSMDVSWRNGYEQVLKDSQVDTLNRQNQQMQQQQQMQPGQQPGQEQVQPGQEPQVPNQEVQPAQGDLDSSIQELETLVSKSEGLSDSALEGLNKALSALKSLPVRASANLPEHTKKAHSAQQKIVEDLLKKWDNESKKSSNNILKVIETEGDR